ncbi:hypothetical protein HLB23_35000 [Nocardia uniformis]|uniref:Secreted protein n=1 Tax=Nocardia uniformis TaxID=53432 RepID=A0A849C8T4_9NOCA|nr:hypothetical protein [Nocardia uniformis]NNH75002.1 hypothetical protein [Nocardia uniformis]
MNMRIVGLLTAVTATLTAPAIAHAEPVTPVATRDATCAFTFQPPQPYLLHDAVLIAGYVTCAARPDDFHISLRLQRREGGNWVTRDGMDSNDIPNPNLNVAARDLDCEPGAWQGAYTMSWSVGDDWGVANNVSTTAIISC